MNTKIRYGIIGTVSILLIFGGYIVLTPDELNHAWYCPMNAKVGIFENLSKTNVTGYWTENSTLKQSTCTKSKWIPLREYCNQMNITNCNKIEHSTTEDMYTDRYWCTHGCDPIVN